MKILKGSGCYFTIIKYLVFIFLIIILFFSACAEKEVSIPGHIIQQEQMVQILAEIHIAEATINYKSIGDSASLNTNTVYNQIFKKYSITAEQYRESYQFYLDHPRLMNKMYDQVINELSRRQSEFQVK